MVECKNYNLLLQALFYVVSLYFFTHSPFCQMRNDIEFFDFSKEICEEKHVHNQFLPFRHSKVDWSKLDA